MRWILVAQVLVGGCRRACEHATAWEDLEVQADPGAEEAAGTVAAAIEQFGLWSGRDELCVSEVRMEPPGNEEAYGSYNPRNGQMLLDAADPDLWGDTFHELCHAVDEADDLSGQAPELFEPSEEIEQSYRRSSQRRETLAYACQDGPIDPGRAQRWQDCGLNSDRDRDIFISNHVYPLAPHFDWDYPALHVEPGTAWALPERTRHWPDLQVAASRDHVVVLRSAGSGRPQVLFLDPLTGSESTSYELEGACSPEAAVVKPGVEAHPLCLLELYSGDSSAYLEAWSPFWSSRRDWELTPEGPVRLPEACSSLGGAVWDGRAWSVIYRDQPQEEYRVESCELATGERQEWVLELPPGLGGPAAWILPTAAGTGVYWPDEGAVLAESGETLLLPEFLAIDRVAAMPDGTWLVPQGLTIDGASWELLAGVDLVSGELLAPELECPVELGGTVAGGYHLLAGDGWAGMVVESDDGALSLFPFQVERL